jgi:hypothetical protein
MPVFLEVRGSAHSAQNFRLRRGAMSFPRSGSYLLAGYHVPISCVDRDSAGETSIAAVGLLLQSDCCQLMLQGYEWQCSSALPTDVPTCNGLAPGYG